MTTDPTVLADVDPIALTRPYLAAHPAVLAALAEAGGTADGWIDAYNRPPYPHLRLLDEPGGSDRDLRWLLAPTLTLHMLGDPDGSPGKAVLRRLLYVVLGVLADLPNQPTEPGQPVVTAVQSRSGGGWVPEPPAQPRYIATVQITAHPAPPAGP